MKFISGPMATISHPAFRNLIERFGSCDEYFTEMINAGTLLTNGPFEKYYIDPSPVPEKIVWQLTGHKTEHMEEAAAVLCELPGIGIDINMGCSAPDIYKTGAGIGWMLKPLEETKYMVKKIRNVVDSAKKTSGKEIRLSVKLRLGDDDFTDDSFFSFCDMLVSNGIELLTLHPRTKKEKLARPARYFYCQKIAERFPGVPVYLNGNVKDENSLKTALAAAPGVKGVMISRACVEKPWIFKQLKGCDEFEIDMKELAEKYIDDIEKFQPKEFWKTRLQRFFTYYAMNFKFAHFAQTAFLNAKDNEALRSCLNDFFEKCPEEKIKVIKNS